MFNIMSVERSRLSEQPYLVGIKDWSAIDMSSSNMYIEVDESRVGKQTFTTLLTWKRRLLCDGYEQHE